jgi:anti-sigma regulatory factor (Ser/Thr protein kinase)
VDYLEKPVTVHQIGESVEKAIRLTRQRRRTQQVASSVKELGQAQKRMIHLNEQHAEVNVKIGYHPKLEAGGDYFIHFRTGPGEHFCLLTDVSGHDLQAAYLSAYFQGFVRGMLQCGWPPVNIFQSINQQLLQEWGGDDLGGADNTSVAACGIGLNLKNRTVNVLTCGVPAPIHVFANNRASYFGAHGGFPIGWFPDFQFEAANHAISDQDQYFLWTDGIVDLAERLMVHPLTIGHRLLDKSAVTDLPELDLAADDILFVRVRLTGATVPTPHFSPLILEQYHGGMAGEIDRLESGWARSLKLALPKISDATRHNILLVSREAVLNGLQHGCQNNPDQSVTYQLSVQPEKRIIRIWVDDPGPGHQFDHQHQESILDSELPGRHLGLVLIHTLAQVVTFERNRASLIMDFYY